MNFHSDEWIMEQMQEHYNEALEYFPKDQIVGLFYQGSGNYGLDYEGSDVDTKLIVVPSFADIALNRKPISTTHVRANDEHIDFKDIRLYIETFRKQNLNFLEILFTKYKIINPEYEFLWNELIDIREEIVRMNPYRSVQSMKGIAMEKYYAMEHEYPSKVAVLAQYGYDPKQLHHLIRVRNYLEKYISGEDYETCLVPPEDEAGYLMVVKKGLYSLEEARSVGSQAIDEVVGLCEDFYNTNESKENEETLTKMRNIQEKIMRKAVIKELSKEEKTNV